MPIVKHEDGTLRYKVAEYWIPKPWQGLTDEERHACTQSPFTEENYRAVEAKLKEKNGG
jgi:hypothetical protein